MNVRIVVAGLTKRYGTRLAVERVSFRVKEGTIFGLLGPNGAGKTSIMECIAGLRQPDEGAIALDGVDALAEPAQARRRLGVALQNTALQDRITPREALQLFGAFYPDAASPKALLARFSLEGKADAPYASLSGGQKQRLALALAFVHHPSVLLLDEPTAGLDAASRRELHQEILRLRDEGCTVLLTTHLLDEAYLLCDELAILRGGRVAATGRPDELIACSTNLPRIILRTAKPVLTNVLCSLAHIDAVKSRDDGVEFETRDVGRSVAAVVQWLERQGNTLLDLDVRRPSLEDTFLELTQEIPPP